MFFLPSLLFLKRFPVRSLSLIFGGLFLFLGLSCAPVSYAIEITSREETRPPPLDVTADRLVYDPQTQRITAEGEVVVVYKTHRLTAHHVVYDRQKNRVLAEGKVELLTPDGTRLQAETSEMQRDFSEGFARHVRLLLRNDATLTSRYITRKENRLTIFEDARYTRCKTCTLANGTPLWEIRSKKATNDSQKQRITHEDMTFLAAGVPIAWLPYFSHPSPGVERASGLLMPRFKYSNLYGMAVETPYYWAIDPSYDLLFTPFFTSKNGAILSAQWRQRLSSGTYTIKGAGLYQFDRASLPNPGDQLWRWYGQTTGDFQLNDRWSWGWDGTLLSDQTFMRRYDLDKRTEIENKLFLSGLRDRNFFSFKVSSYEGLLATDNNRQFPFFAPSLSHSATLDSPVFGGAVNFETSAYAIFRKEAFSPYPGVTQGTGQARASETVRWQREWITPQGIQATPFVQGRGDLYWTENLPQNAQKYDFLARVLPSAGVDLRWPWIQSSQNSQHLITPVAQLIVRPQTAQSGNIGNEDAISLNFDSTNLFLDKNMTGLDRTDTRSVANLGALYHYQTDSGKRFQASFGDSIAFVKDPTLPLESGLSGTFSDLVGSFSAEPFENIFLYTQARLDPHTATLKSIENGLTITQDNFSGNLNYTHLEAEPSLGRPKKEEQIWFSGDYRLYEGWSLFGGLRYDFSTRKIIKGVGGIGYTCDCAQVRLSYQEDAREDRDVDNNRSIVLSIELKTLGGTRISPDL